MKKRGFVQDSQIPKHPRNFEVHSYRVITRNNSLIDCRPTSSIRSSPFYFVRLKSCYLFLSCEWLIEYRISRQRYFKEARRKKKKESVLHIYFEFWGQVIPSVVKTSLASIVRDWFFLNKNHRYHFINELDIQFVVQNFPMHNVPNCIFVTIEKTWWTIVLINRNFFVLYLLPFTIIYLSSI